jgi:hypothetical protein
MTDVTSRRNLILTPRVVGVVTGLLLLIALGSYLKQLPHGGCESYLC